MTRVLRVLSVLARVVVCVAHVIVNDSSHFLSYAASKPNADDSGHNSFTTIYVSNRVLSINGYLI